MTAVLLVLAVWLLLDALLLGAWCLAHPSASRAVGSPASAHLTPTARGTNVVIPDDLRDLVPPRDAARRLLGHSPRGTSA